MDALYLKSYKSGSLDKVIDKAYALLGHCLLCPRKCGVNRLAGEKGFCRTGARAKVHNYLSHRGEEPPVSGANGSGAIFFSNCNMACCYCQNYSFSQEGEGRQAGPEELAGYMLELQAEGCHNINLVTPTHVMPQILQALRIAVGRGLKIPLVYNTSGYELPEIISMLEGIVDIYLADMRYAKEQIAVRLSQAPGYPGYSRRSIKEMHRQVGIAYIDKTGIIKRGVIVRHLVLPNALSGTEEIMRFLSQELSPNTYVSLMSQYTPYYKAVNLPEISRRAGLEEYEKAIEAMHRAGLYNGWTQESGGLERFAGVNLKSNLTQADDK